ncbi:MAG TPA: response regulator [Acidobacteriota bacterium]|nr:response regulator [Acidobacteriota bacterium]HNC44641.1 response regulator [Acidobacteriota bacterium]HNH81627.1 response regulator [Acidobacteriota bacterium]
MITAIIVDDERVARKMLRTLLQEYPQIQVVGEAQSVSQAAEVMASTKPDVVFLDIQMPGGTGFELLNRVQPGCQIVFVTAYHEFAVKAFDVKALDFLLKPVDPARLTQTIERITDVLDRSS